MTRAAVALGSNLGDRLAHLRAGVAGVRRLGTVVSVSSLYETEPVGGPDQGRYLNAVAIVDTDLSPHDLLAALHVVESEAGRTREVRWGPRTLDLDIVAYGAETVESADLQIPHPRAAERSFVLDPLVEIAPNTPVGGGRSASEARAVLGGPGGFRWEGMWVESQPRLGWRGPLLVVGQFVLFAVLAVVALTTASYPIPPWRAVLGVAVAAVGGWLVVGAVVALGANLSALPDPVPEGRLVDRGVFGVVRHPIYGGLLLGGLAVSVTLGTAWVLPVLAALAVLLWHKSGLEERALTLAYPEYPAYADRVTKRFVPYLL